MVDKLLVIIAGLGMGCVWMFLIEPWLDRRPRNGGFVKPEVYAKSNQPGTSSCGTKNPS